ncbi:hypothetical protein A5906_24545 [Bradyrhizobium sacchari]|nr:hypothetical protein A5906_24545 [Bradyrhizobium sacchari]
MRADLGLSCFANGVVALGAWWKGFGLFSEAFGFLGKAFFERNGLLEPAASLHDTTSFCGS